MPSTTVAQLTPISHLGKKTAIRWAPLDISYLMLESGFDLLNEPVLDVML
jgi:hypothetical protein